MTSFGDKMGSIVMYIVAANKISYIYIFYFQAQTTVRLALCIYCVSPELLFLGALTARFDQHKNTRQGRRHNCSCHLDVYFNQPLIRLRCTRTPGETPGLRCTNTLEYLEELQVDVRQATRAQLHLQRAERGEQLQGNDWAESCAHRRHALHVLQLPQAKATHGPSVHVLVLPAWVQRCSIRRRRGGLPMLHVSQWGVFGYLTVRLRPPWQSSTSSPVMVMYVKVQQGRLGESGLSPEWCWEVISAHRASNSVSSLTCCFRNCINILYYYYNIVIIWKRSIFLCSKRWMFQFT